MPKTLQDLLDGDSRTGRLRTQVSRLEGLRAPRAVQAPVRQRLATRATSLQGLYDEAEGKRKAQEESRSKTEAAATLRKQNTTQRTQMTERKQAFFTDPSGKVRPITGPAGNVLVKKDSSGVLWDESSGKAYRFDGGKLVDAATGVPTEKRKKDGIIYDHYQDGRGGLPDVAVDVDEASPPGMGELKKQVSTEETAVREAATIASAELTLQGKRVTEAKRNLSALEKKERDNPLLMDDAGLQKAQVDAAVAIDVEREKLALVQLGAEKALAAKKTFLEQKATRLEEGRLSLVKEARERLALTGRKASAGNDVIDGAGSQVPSPKSKVQGEVVTVGVLDPLVGALRAHLESVKNAPFAWSTDLNDVSGLSPVPQGGIGRHDFWGRPMAGSLLTPDGKLAGAGSPQSSQRGTEGVVKLPKGTLYHGLQEVPSRWLEPRARARQGAAKEAGMADFFQGGGVSLKDGVLTAASGGGGRGGVGVGERELGRMVFDVDGVPALELEHAGSGFGKAHGRSLVAGYVSPSLAAGKPYGGLPEFAAADDAFVKELTTQDGYGREEALEQWRARRWGAAKTNEFVQRWKSSTDPERAEMILEVHPGLADVPAAHRRLNARALWEGGEISRQDARLLEKVAYGIEPSRPGLAEWVDRREAGLKSLKVSEPVKYREAVQKLVTEYFRLNRDTVDFDSQQFTADRNALMGMMPEQSLGQWAKHVSANALGSSAGILIGMPLNVLIAGGANILAPDSPTAKGSAEALSLMVEQSGHAGYNLYANVRERVRAMSPWHQNRFEEMRAEISSLLGSVDKGRRLTPEAWQAARDRIMDRAADLMAGESSAGSQVGVPLAERRDVMRRWYDIGDLNTRPGEAFATYLETRDPMAADQLIAELLANPGERGAKERAAMFASDGQEATGYWDQVRQSYWGGTVAPASEVAIEWASTIVTLGLAKAFGVGANAAVNGARAEVAATRFQRMWEGWKRAGVQVAKPGQSLTLGQRALNQGAALGKLAAVTAPLEGGEEYVAAFQEAGAHHDEAVKQGVDGFFGGMTLAPIFHGVQMAREGIANHKDAIQAARERETFEAELARVVQTHNEHNPDDPIDLEMARQASGYLPARHGDVRRFLDGAQAEMERARSLPEGPEQDAAVQQAQDAWMRASQLQFKLEEAALNATRELNGLPDAGAEGAAMKAVADAALRARAGRTLTPEQERLLEEYTLPDGRKGFYRTDAETRRGGDAETGGVPRGTSTNSGGSGAWVFSDAFREALGEVAPRTAGAFFAEPENDQLERHAANAGNEVSGEGAAVAADGNAGGLQTEGAAPAAGGYQFTMDYSDGQGRRTEVVKLKATDAAAADKERGEIVMDREFWRGRQLHSAGGVEQAGVAPQPQAAPVVAPTPVKGAAEVNAELLAGVAPEVARAMGFEETLNLPEVEMTGQVPGLLAVRLNQQPGVGMAARYEMVFDSRASAEQFMADAARRGLPHGINDVGTMSVVNVRGVNSLDEIDALYGTRRVVAPIAGNAVDAGTQLVDDKTAAESRGAGNLAEEPAAVGDARGAGSGGVAQAAAPGPVATVPAGRADGAAPRAEGGGWAKSSLGNQTYTRMPDGSWWMTDDAAALHAWGGNRKAMPPAPTAAPQAAAELEAKYQAAVQGSAEGAGRQDAGAPSNEADRSVRATVGEADKSVRFTASVTYQPKLGGGEITTRLKLAGDTREDAEENLRARVKAMENKLGKVVRVGEVEEVSGPKSKVSGSTEAPLEGSGPENKASEVTTEDGRDARAPLGNIVAPTQARHWRPTAIFNLVRNVASAFGFKIADTGIDVGAVDRFGNPVNLGTQMFDKLLEAPLGQGAADVGHWIDNINNSGAVDAIREGMTAPWWHRVWFGHDVAANLPEVVEQYGAGAIPDFLLALAKDATTKTGIPLPGTEWLVHSGAVSDKVAGTWLSVNVGELFGGGLAIWGSLRLHKSAKAGALRTSRLSTVLALVGVGFKVVGGVMTAQPVLILAGLADSVILLTHLGDIRKAFQVSGSTEAAESQDQGPRSKVSGSTEGAGRPHSLDGRAVAPRGVDEKEWMAARTAALGRFQGEELKKARVAIEWLEANLPAWVPLFSGGVEVARPDGTFANSKRSRVQGGVAAEPNTDKNDKVQSVTLTVDLGTWAENFRGQEDRARRQALREEFVHAAALTLYDYHEMADFFARVIEQSPRLAKTVVAGYHNYRLRNQLASGRAKYVADNIPDSTLEAMLQETGPMVSERYRMGHEFLRMLVEDSEFAGEVGETLAANPSIAKQIIEFLKKLADHLRALISTAPDALKAEIQDRELSLRKLVRDQMNRSATASETVRGGVAQREVSGPRSEVSGSTEAGAGGAAHEAEVLPPKQDHFVIKAKVEYQGKEDDFEVSVNNRRIKLLHLDAKGERTGWRHEIILPSDLGEIPTPEAMQRFFDQGLRIAYTPDGWTTLERVDKAKLQANPAKALPQGKPPTATPPTKRVEDMTLDEFREAMKAGRVGYNPFGDVVSPETIRALQEKYGKPTGEKYTDTGREVIEGYENSSAYHAELGRLYGYSEADIARFLAHSKWALGERAGFKKAMVDGKVPVERIPEKYVREAYEDLKRRPPPPPTVDAAAHEAATSPKNDLPEPTHAQKEAGNYAKGHVTVSGLDISIENPVGSVRSGKDKSGKPWSVTMTAHYGYVKRTEGKDGDQVDVFLAPGLGDEGRALGSPQRAQSDTEGGGGSTGAGSARGAGSAVEWDGPVFVVNQVDPETGKFDEHKVVLGVRNAMQARDLYLAHYEEGWKGLGSMAMFPSVDAFKAWLNEGDLTKAAPRGGNKNAGRNEDGRDARAPLGGRQGAKEALRKVLRSRRWRDAVGNDMISLLRNEVGRIVPPKMRVVRDGKGRIARHEIAEKGGEWDFYRAWLDGKDLESKSRRKAFAELVFDEGKGIPLDDAAGYLREKLNDRPLGEALEAAFIAREKLLAELLKPEPDIVDVDVATGEVVLSDGTRMPKGSLALMASARSDTGTGDMFSGTGSDPFNLVPELPADRARREAYEARVEATRKERAAAEALKAAEKQQGTLFAAPRTSGHAQPLDAGVSVGGREVRSIGSLRVGDEIAGVDGSVTKVAAVFPQGRQKVFEIQVSGSGMRRTRATEDHLWVVKLGPERDVPSVVLSTRHVARYLAAGVAVWVPVVG